MSFDYRMWQMETRFNYEKKNTIILIQDLMFMSLSLSKCDEDNLNKYLSECRNDNYVDKVDYLCRHLINHYLNGFYNKEQLLITVINLINEMLEIEIRHYNDIQWSNYVLFESIYVSYLLLIYKLLDSDQVTNDKLYDLVYQTIVNFRVNSNFTNLIEVENRINYLNCILIKKDKVFTELLINQGYFLDLFDTLMTIDEIYGNEHLIEGSIRNVLKMCKTERGKIHFKEHFDDVECIIRFINEEILGAWRLLDLYCERELEQEDIDILINNADILWDQIQFDWDECIDAFKALIQYPQIQESNIMSGLTDEIINVIKYNYYDDTYIHYSVDELFKSIMDLDIKIFMDKWNAKNMTKHIRDKGMYYKNILSHPKFNTTLKDRCINYVLMEGEDLPWCITY